MKTMVMMKMMNNTKIKNKLKKITKIMIMITKRIKMKLILLKKKFKIEEMQET